MIQPDSANPWENAPTIAGASGSSAPIFISTPMRRMCSPCCASAESGHAVAEPTIPLMKSRRRIAFLKAQDCADLRCNYSRDLTTAEWGSGVSLHGSNLEPLMCASGQKQTFKRLRLMSALGDGLNRSVQHRL